MILFPFALVQTRCGASLQPDNDSLTTNYFFKKSSDSKYYVYFCNHKINCRGNISDNIEHINIVRQGANKIPTLAA